MAQKKVFIPSQWGNIQEILSGQSVLIALILLGPPEKKTQRQTINVHVNTESIKPNSPQICILFL